MIKPRLVRTGVLAAVTMVAPSRSPHRHTADLGGAIWDRCGADGKGDGAGACARGRVRFGNGTWPGWSEWRGDSSGCGDAGTTWGDWFSFPDRTITDLEVRLCERDNGDPIECGNRVHDNPEVAG